MDTVDHKDVSTEFWVAIWGAVVTLVGGTIHFLSWLFKAHRRHVLLEDKIDNLCLRMDKMEERSDVRAGESAQVMELVSRIAEKLDVN